MALYKQKGSAYWWISIYQGGGIPRKRISSGTADLSEAKAIEAVFNMALKGNARRDKLIKMLDMILGYDEQVTGIPIGSIGSTYKNLSDHKAGDSTITTQCTHTQRMTDWIQREWPTVKFMHQISREAAVAYGDHLRKQCATGKTYNNTRGNIVRVFNALLVRGGCQENVFALTATANTHDSQTGRSFTAEEQKAILQVCQDFGKNWYEVSLVAKYTGMREGDIQRLKPDQLKNGVIKVTPSKTAKHNIKLRIPMHPVLLDLFDGWDLSGKWVFPEQAPKGKQLKNKARSSEYSTILHKAGLRMDGYYLTFHCWRHTFCTSLARAGVDPAVIKRAGGWLDGNTADHYNHDITQLKAGIDLLD